MITKTCDRCGNLMHPTLDKTVAPFLSEVYEKDICPDCDLEIIMATGVARRAAIEKKTCAEVARRWLNLYE